MTDKDSNDMTASELLRKAADQDAACHSTGIDELAYLMGINDGTCYSVRFEALADKIDAELAQARELSLRAGAELWAKANGWPGFKPGEDFGAWLDRCTYKKPVDDCNEPVQFGDEIELHYLIGGADKGRFQEVTVNRGPVWMLSFTGVDHERLYRYDSECDILKRPAPEVLGADGKPIKVGETVYPIDGEWIGIPLEVSGIESPASVKVYLSAGKSWTTFHADSLTHTPPDTLERLRDDIAEWRADCAKPGSGWDVKTAEWADRIDAIIRRRGSAE